MYVSQQLTRRFGFTLIELLVAIAIIAILARLVVISLNEQRVQARDASRRSALVQYGTALEQYHAQSHSYMLEPAGCHVTKSTNFYPDGTSFPLPEGDVVSCVGYHGGAWGSVNRRSPLAGPNIAGYPGTQSIAEALRTAGYLQTISTEPRSNGAFPSQSASAIDPNNFDDFILTLCNSDGRPAADPTEATEYGLFAALEKSPSTGSVSGTKANNSCGGPNTLYPWNTIQ